MDIINGLHQFVGHDPEFSALAQKSGALIKDNRKPPKDLVLTSGENRSWKVPTVAVLSTDAACGKHVSIMQFLKEARKRGYDPGLNGCALWLLADGGNPDS